MLISGFILGLMGSLHCVGMCGPIAFMLPVDRENNFNKGFQITLYHIGRILAYTSIGLLIGALGRGLNLFGIQQQISIFIGILMILVIVLPYFISFKKGASNLYSKYLLKIRSGMGQLFKKRSADAFLTMGFLNGYLPCGLVYLGVLGALAMESLWTSAIYMVLFGIGTVPLMTITVYLGNFLNAKARKKIKQLIPVAVVIIGVLFILRGLGLGIPFISPEPIPDMASGAINCH